MPDPASTRRAAAIATLLLTALFVVAVTALVLSSPLYLLANWAGLVVLLIGIARAVRFRGARRFVGVLLAVIGLGVAVVSIVAAGDNGILALLPTTAPAPVPPSAGVDRPAPCLYQDASHGS